MLYMRTFGTGISKLAVMLIPTDKKMASEKDIAKVVLVDEHQVTIDFGEGRTKTLEKRQLSKYIRLDDLVRHCEHGFYDIVDDKGNLIFRES